VAVSQDGASIFSKEDFNGPSHATVLGVFVDEALSFIDSHAIPLDAVAVSCGPGSYTGLRIGVSMAKGICYGRNIPLIGLPTLEGFVFRCSRSIRLPLPTEATLPRLKSFVL
jgi:tRNA threonylcarbamoyladenosine biosynthesis protein TsaB